MESFNIYNDDQENQPPPGHQHHGVAAVKRHYKQDGRSELDKAAAAIPQLLAKHKELGGRPPLISRPVLGQINLNTGLIRHGVSSGSGKTALMPRGAPLPPPHKSMMEQQFRCPRTAASDSIAGSSRPVYATKTSGLSVRQAHGATFSIHTDAGGGADSARHGASKFQPTKKHLDKNYHDKENHHDKENLPSMANKELRHLTGEENLRFQLQQQQLLHPYHLHPQSSVIQPPQSVLHPPQSLLQHELAANLHLYQPPQVQLHQHRVNLETMDVSLVGDEAGEEEEEVMVLLDRRNSKAEYRDVRHHEDLEDEDEEEERLLCSSPVVSSSSSRHREWRVPPLPNTADIFSQPDYFQDIYNYLRESEDKHMPKWNYMTKQTDITHPMRSILMDWLVEVSEEYKLQTETLYLAANYIDRFLSLMAVQRSKLQLVGTACMFIAAKYEEIYPPDVSEFVYITDDTYNKRQVLRMEHLVLKVLNFDLSVPTAHVFLNKMCQMFKGESDEDDRVRCLALYLCELALVAGDEFLRWEPSVVAASSIAMARHTLHLEAWPASLEEGTDYKVADLGECLVVLHSCFKAAKSSSQQAVREKYKVDKYHQVSEIEPLVSMNN